MADLEERRGEGPVFLRRVVGATTPGHPHRLARDLARVAERDRRGVILLAEHGVPVQITSLRSRSGTLRGRRGLLQDVTPAVVVGIRVVLTLPLRYELSNAREEAPLTDVSRE